MTIRSAKHYADPNSLKVALCEPDANGAFDWKVEYDKETSHDATVDFELDRLSVLQSYDILESPKDPVFDSITAEAKEFFNTPIAVVSLIDLGRQWFKSIQGLDAEETPRCISFCTHVVQRKDGPMSPILVVPDATKDDRFKNNPLVVDGPKIRFYAGAPLISPEGPKLGSFCVIDFKPRPALTVHEKQKLQSFAREAVLQMISRVP